LLHHHQNWAKKVNLYFVFNEETTKKGRAQTKDAKMTINFVCHSRRRTNNKKRFVQLKGSNEPRDNDLYSRPAAAASH